MVKLNQKQHITRRGVVKRNPPKKVNLYLDYKKRVEADINRFPIQFAFNEEQLKEALNKLGATKNEVISVFGSGIIRKSDRPKFAEMLDRHDREHKAMMQNKNYVYDMFRYELANHEYCITYDVEETLSALDLTKAQVNSNPLLREQLEKAKRDYLKNAGDC